MNEFSEINLKETLNLIIEEKYKKAIDDWLFDAKPNERKGLFVISKIIKCKGEKAFRDKLDQNVEKTELSMENAYKRYQKRAFSSTYKDEFCLSVDPKFKYNNILKYKKFEFVRKSYKIIFILSG
jgi:hypothetical protein